MMKIKTKNNRLAMGVICAAVLICGTVAFYTLNKRYANVTENKQSSTPERSASDIQQAKDLTDQPSSKETQSNTDTPAPITTDKNTGKSVVQMVSSFDISRGTLYIRGGINNSVEYEGTCFAELIAPDGKIIKKETTLLQNSATTDCRTISIPVTELRSGHWKFTLNYTSNNKIGKTNESSFEL
jgi:hypothetical protein